ncbi:receptor-like protein kinase BRI1-like 3 [Phalaenopsis equestris]|uniref:receptor-like protein kinase BRI1-like 3 n=1 Tax=Phalaenopsis equestris TaxID=78828 RepID=UPI0009E53867|nr:receptor-like protein kinase BRI1-like 3 [Phalaenopsis equestris]
MANTGRMKQNERTLLALPLVSASPLPQFFPTLETPTPSTPDLNLPSDMIPAPSNPTTLRRTSCSNVGHPPNRFWWDHNIANFVLWKSKKYSVVARSTTETEYKVMTLGVVEMMWLKALLVELKVDQGIQMKLHYLNYCYSYPTANPSRIYLITVLSFCISWVDLKLQTGSFSLSQIKDATNNFSASNKIGEGGFGSVYRGLLSDGTVIAVKQLSSKSTQGNREFLNEMGLITALQHPNLVRLYGCCVEGNQLLLVYEYLENNSLANALFGKDHSISSFAKKSMPYS